MSLSEQKDLHDPVKAVGRIEDFDGQCQTSKLILKGHWVKIKFRKNHTLPTLKNLEEKLFLIQNQGITVTRTEL